MIRRNELFTKVQCRISESRIWELEKGDRYTLLVGLALVSALVMLGFFADIVAPYSPIDPVGPSNSPPSSQYLMGTDVLGRDVLSRVIYGVRVSLIAGFISVLVAAGVGSTLGVITGYLGGNLDKAVTIPLNALYALPVFLVALLMAVTLGGTILTTAIAIAVALIPKFYRTTRSASMCFREEDFVQAEIAIGASDSYIIFRHIYPLCLNVIAVIFTMSISTAILSIAALGFLGVGLAPPTPEWGLDIAMARRFIPSNIWWSTLGPSIFIFLTVLGFNILGEGINKMAGTVLEEV